MLSLTRWPVWLAGSARSMVLGAQLEFDLEYPEYPEYPEYLNGIKRELGYF